MKTNMALVVAVLVLMCNGCCCFPFLYPKTGAHGVVVDQYDRPVANVKMQASWSFRSLHDVMMARGAKQDFSTDGEGKWFFYRRDAERMYIEAAPPAGYKYALREDRVRATYFGPLGSGECPTNDVLLRMIKIEPNPNPKEAK